MKRLFFSLFFSVPVILYAGGNNDLVQFPQGYKENFAYYHSMNRAGTTQQVAELYANDIAMQTAGTDKLGPGSIIVMEIYKAKLDETGKAIKGPDSLYEKGNFAAVAVMEKRIDWGSAYPAEQRAGDWGFALYTPEGQPKANELVCQTCHQPLAEQDFLFSYKQLHKK